jgi:uncharacterized damage-inducible protein DinB
MHLPAQIAKHFREVYFGGNWTVSNLKDHLAGLSWQQATTPVYGFNTIATLVFHINYYVTAVTAVLQGVPLNAKDEYSFQHPPIQSQQDWDGFVEKTFADAEVFAQLVEQLPAEKMWENLAGEKYGNYYRNLHGIIEHCHYHLGQIVLIKKIIERGN